MKIKFQLFIAFLIGLSCTLVHAADTDLPREFKGMSPLQWSIKTANSQMARKGPGMSWTEGGRKKWDYADNVFLLGIIKLGQQTQDTKYAKFADGVISSFVQADGSIRTYNAEDYTLDNINPGKTLLALYEQNQNDGYRLAAANLRKQLTTHPRTADGGFWHKKVYPQQMWLDGIYMASPFLAQYGKLFNEPGNFDEVAKQIKLIAAHTYSEKTGLFYHGWDSAKQQPWANKETGLSANFWSRAIGWFAMALVDTLDYMPADHPARPEIIAILDKTAAGIVKNQDPSGLWWQVTDQPDREGNYLEATGSAMFVYTLAKGVNKGYLSKDYIAPAIKGYSAIVDKLIKIDGDNVTLTKCCSVAGLGPGNSRNGSFEYYIHEPIVDNDMKGVGPFVMAGIELQQIVNGK
ncbi:MAG TPA: glycoside hydrolase family 88 protein [Tepidisphaeraceae bacterium]|nr:glycoside hydrolase family 88 protein [Tepidisphaeraceae bacterium]